MLQNKLIQITFRILLIIFIASITLYLLPIFIRLLYPFIIAFFIAYSINPTVNYLEKIIKIPRYLAVIISILFIILLISSLLFLLINEIIHGTQFLANVVPIYFKHFIQVGQDFTTTTIIPIYENILLKFNKLDTNNQETIIQNIQRLADSTTNTGTTLITNSLLGLSSLISQLPTTLTVLFVTILSTFFISKDWGKFQTIGQKKIPSHIQKGLNILVTQLKLAIFGFMKAQITLIFITTIILFIGLVLLQVPYAITISIIIGLIDIVPYLGTGIILVPWIIYSFIIGSTQFAAALTILYIIILIQRQIMEPKIISSNIGIDPLSTLISVFVGYQLFGILGMILAPISLVMITNLYKIGIFYYIWNIIVDKKK